MGIPSESQVPWEMQVFSAQPQSPCVSLAACTAFGTTGAEQALLLTAQSEQSHEVTAAVTAVTSPDGAGCAVPWVLCRGVWRWQQTLLCPSHFTTALENVEFQDHLSWTPLSMLKMLTLTPFKGDVSHPFC